jgi:hypothetical protein
MRWSGLCLAAVVVASAAPAVADERAPSTDQLHDDSCCPVSTLRRTAAILAAVGPGLFIRGTGSYLVHRKRTAKQLLKVGAIGLGGAALGGAAVGISGGYPPTLTLMPVLLVGGGLFVTSWWADIAVAAGLDKVSHGTARATMPWSVELATLWLDDPFRTAGLVRAGGRVDRGRIGVGASGTVDAENVIRIGEAEVRYRILGAPPTGTPIADGSRLVVRAGGRVLADDGDGVTITTGELEVIGRYDLFRLDRTLAGTFLQLSTGIGIESVDFTRGHDFNEVFLATFAWGVYLGNRGETAIYYDHRRDTLVGGLPAYRAAGFVGSVGAYVDWMLDRRFATRLQLDWGNALVTTFGIRVQGARP